MNRDFCTRFRIGSFDSSIKRGFASVLEYRFCKSLRIQVSGLRLHKKGVCKRLRIQVSGFLGRK